jgi:hypothetical protein
MSALTMEITATLQSLDPKRAQALERAIHDLLIVVRPDPHSADTPPANSGVDANGWPIGYWEKFAGCPAGQEWDAQPDPPPEAHPW